MWILCPRCPCDPRTDGRAGTGAGAGKEFTRGEVRTLTCQDKAGLDFRRDFTLTPFRAGRVDRAGRGDLTQRRHPRPA